MDAADRGDGEDRQDEPAQETRCQDSSGDGPLSGNKARKLRRVRFVPGGQEKTAPVREEAPQRTTPSDHSPEGKGGSYMHFVHFDAETGLVSYIDDDKSAFGAVCECPKCGTALQFEAERCPVCGTRIDEGDSGIVSLLGEKGFDWRGPPEMDCPQCGEHVRLVRGVCPSCRADIMPAGGAEADEHPGRLVSAENVVFVHLDVESGEVEYLQRLDRSRGLGHVAVQLKDDGSNGSAEG